MLPLRFLLLLLPLVANICVCIITEQALAAYGRTVLLASIPPFPCHGAVSRRIPQYVRKSFCRGMVQRSQPARSLHLVVGSIALVPRMAVSVVPTNFSFVACRACDIQLNSKLIGIVARHCLGPCVTVLRYIPCQVSTRWEGRWHGTCGNHRREGQVSRLYPGGRFVVNVRDTHKAQHVIVPHSLTGCDSISIVSGD